MRTRLVPYVPFGAKLAPLPDALESQLVAPLGELPTASVHYHRDGTNATVLDGIVELGFEYWNGTTWVEPPSARFLSMSGSFDHLEETPTRNYSFIGIGWMLRRAKVWESNGLPVDADGKVQFLSANAGTIMATLIQNAKGRGWGAGIEVDFSATKDSAGQAWAKVLTIAYDLDLDLEAVLSNLYQQGVCDYRWEGRTLRIFNSDTAMGRDLTTGTSPLRLIVADGQSSAPEDWTNEDLITDALVLGEEGKSWKFGNGSNTPLGRLETVITQGGVNDPGTASLLSEVDLLQGSQTRVSYTREFAVFDDSPVWPFRDFVPGDWVQAQRGTGFERLRTHSLSLTISASGVRGHSVLGDRLDDLLTKLAKRTKGITGGASAGGSGVRPAPEGPDNRNPAAPIGFVASSHAYTDAEGDEMGMVSFGWAHTGKATNGTEIDVDRFQFRIRESGISEPGWRSFLSVPGSDRTGTFSPVRVRRQDGRPEVYDFAIRAMSGASRPSAWVYYRNLLMETDTTPPPVPSALVAIPAYVTASVAWDGRGAGNEDMPPDFSHVDGEVGASPEGPWVFFGSYERAATQSIPFALGYGMHWLRARSVDRTGNVSEWSELSTVEIRPLVDLPDVHDLIDDYNQKFAEALAESGIAINSANSKNRIKHSTSTPSVDGGEREGDVWFRYNNAQMSVRIGSWQWSGTAWVPATFGHQILDSIDLGKATVGMLDGVYIKAKSLNAMHIMVGDFTNLCSIDPVMDVNVTVPAAFTTVSAGGYTYKADGGSDYLMFKDQSGPVPFKSGDWLRVTFDAMATTDTTIPTTVYVYPNTTGTAGSVTASGDTITVTPTVQHYSFDIQVPNLGSIGGGKSWTMGLAGAGARAIGVKNVVVYKKVDATTIAPDSIRTPHLGAEIIEGVHIKGNTIEGDNLVFGFADGKVITGALIQTVAQAARGIKLRGDTNRIDAYNAAGVRTFHVNGSTGDVNIGDGKIVMYGGSGDVNIGQGRFTVAGSTGNLTIGTSNVFQVNGTTGNLNIGNGKLTVSGSTGNVEMLGATLRAGVVEGGRITMRGTGVNQGYYANLSQSTAGGYLAFGTPSGNPNAEDGNSGTLRAEAADDGGRFGITRLGLRSPTTSIDPYRARFFVEAWNSDNGPGDRPRCVADGDIVMMGSGQFWGLSALAIDSQGTLDIGVNAPGVRSTVIRDRPYTGAANVYVTEGGFLGQTSSAARFKLDQQVMDLPDALLDIPVKDWIDKTSSDEVSDLLDLGVRTLEQQAVLESSYGRRRTPGVVAENVAAVKGGNSFVTHDADGQVQGVAYDRLAIAQIAVLNRQLKAERKRNDSLEKRLTALEKKTG